MAGYIGTKAAVVTPGAERKKVFSITTTTTSLTGLAYTPGFVHVFHNGVRLVDGTDYTATNGTSVVLTSGAAAGDLLQVIAFKSFTVADMVPASTGGTFSGNVAVNGNFTVDTNTLFVDAANNRVGIGTSSPTAGLTTADGFMSFVSADANGYARFTATEASAQLGLFRSGSSAGGGYLGANSDASFIVYDGSFAERMRIGANGIQRNNVALVVSSGQETGFYGGGDGVGLYDLNAYSSCGAHIEVATDATTGWANIYLSRTWNTGEDTRQISFYVNGSGVGSIDSTTSGTSYNTSSDYRLKENVVPLAGAADRLMQIPVHRFNFIADPDKTVDGFLAHEVQAFVPECVTGQKDEVDDEGNPKYQGIDQSKLVPLLTAALQEALARIETLEADVAALKGEPA